jgi:WD40 repeat protein
MAMRKSICWFIGLALLSTACKASVLDSPPTPAGTQFPPTVEATLLPSRVATLDEQVGVSTEASPAPNSTLTLPALSSLAPEFQETPSQTAIPAAMFVAEPISPQNAVGLVQLKEIRFSPWDLVMAISWSPGGEFLAVSAGEEIYLYDATTWEPLSSIKVGAFTLSLAFSPDGVWLAAASRDGFVRIWNLAELQDRNAETTRPAMVLDAHRKGANCVAFSPDSRLLASGGNDAVARIWSLADGREVNEIVGGTFAIPSIAFTPDGASLAMVNGEVVRLRDIASGRIVGTLMFSGASFYSVAISPDGHLLAAGDNNNLVRLWDPAQAYRTGQETYPIAIDLIGHAGKAGTYQALIWQLAFSPGGDLLASAGGDATVRLWDPVSAELLATLYGHVSGVTSVAFNPGRRSLASGGLDATLRIWGLGQ